MSDAADPSRAYRSVAVAAALPAVALVMAFVGLPVITIVSSALDPGALAELFTDPALRRVLWFTAWQATVSTAITLAVGLPITWAVSAHSWRGRRLVTGLVSTPFVMPTVVMALAVRSMLPSGADTGITAILVAHVLFNVAVVVRTVGPRWSTVDPELAEAARVLGATRTRAALDTLWPQLSSAVANAGAITFVFCFTSFGVVSILGGSSERTVEVEIFRRAIQVGDTGAAIALSVAQVAVVAVVLAAFGRGAPASGRVRTRLRPLAEVTPGVRTATCVVAVVAAVVAVAPLAAVALDSMRNDGRWSASGWRHLVDGSLRPLGVDIGAALFNSVVFAAVAAGIAVPAATALAAGGTHLGRPGRVLGAVALGPLVVSSITLAFGIVLAFDTAPFAWRDDPWLLPVIHAMIALPLVHRIVAPAIGAVAPSQRDAARVLGATPLRAILDVDLAQSRRAVAAGAGLAAAVSVGEFGASTMLARSGSSTVPVVIGRLAGRAGDVPQQASQALAALMGLVVVGLMARA